MKSLKGKKLLVLGGSASNVQLVNYAHELGATVIVADNLENRPAKIIADDSVLLSTDDYDNLVQYIQDNGIDGIIAGAGEWHIVNAMRIAKKAGLNYYANEEQWNYCQDKRNFKDLCKRYGVPIVPEFSMSDKLSSTDFPVIVKPVDGCSSRGISVCRNQEELNVAVDVALSSSSSNQVIIEKYVENGGVTIDAKYIVADGVFYLEALGERYVLNNGLITAISFYPSEYIENFKRKVDPYVKKMFESIGYKNGVFFFQAIPDGDNIYVYEMGLRVSGGMIYNMTEAVGGNNAMKMLIYYSLTGKVCEHDDIPLINPYFHGKVAATLSLPLRVGKIGQIIGMEQIPTMKDVVDVTVYYHADDSILPKYVNTLDQLFARIMIVSESKEELLQSLSNVRQMVSVVDQDGSEMIIWDTFDRIYKERIAKNNL